MKMVTMMISLEKLYLSVFHNNPLMALNDPEWVSSPLSVKNTVLAPSSGQQNTNIQKNKPTILFCSYYKHSV